MTIIRPFALLGATASVLALTALACGGSDDNAALDGGSEDSASPTKDAGEKDAAKKADGGEKDGAAEKDAANKDAGTPFLTSLSVTAKGDAAVADGGAPLGLVPAFSSDIHDYYVRCEAGTNDLAVAMTASAGANTLVTKPTSSGSLPKQTVSVSVTENEAIVAAATDGNATTEYWVRCLPHDFPQLEMIAHPAAGTPVPGYYMIGNLSVPTGESGYAMVLDGNGVPVWYSLIPGKLGVVDTDNIAPGAISFIPSATTAPTSFNIRTLSPLATTTIGPEGYLTDEHELLLLANGDYLVLSYPLTSGIDLTGLNLPGGPDGGTVPGASGSTIQDCEVVEFKPTGAVVKTWLASAHLNASEVSTLPLAAFGPGAISQDGGFEAFAEGGTLPDSGPPVYDVFHCNSMDVDPANGNLLISARELDSIFYVDWTSTGKVLWKMGGKPATLPDNPTQLTVADPFFRQHDARFQPGWSPTCNGGTGQISLFDDESAIPAPAVARGVVYDVAVGGGTNAGCAPPDGGKGADAGSTKDGSAAGEAGSTGDAGETSDAGSASDGGDNGDSGAQAPGTAVVSWAYPGTANTAATGSFRILSDGSRTIGWGLGNAAGIAFSEVDVNKNDLLDFKFTDGNSTYRAIKVPLSAFDIDTLRNTAGKP